MPLKRLIQVPLLFLLFLTPVYAQYAPGIDWKKIETEHMLLVFPEELRDAALDVAGTIDLIYEKESQDFGSGHKTRWPLILTNSGMVSNGYVSMPPRKGVWFGTPAADGLSTLDWYELLGLHETRHMVQMDSMNMRFIRFLYFIGGELAQTGGIHLSVPRWFLEGDAVTAETLYSDSGRGRDPMFFNQLKVMSLSGDYTYQQFVNRSYKDFYPNRYSFGYFMTSYIRREYGEESWNRILETTATLPLPALGLYVGSKKVTGKTWARLFLDMMEDLKSHWEEEIHSVEMREDTLLLTRPADDYSRYEVLFADSSRVLAYRYSLAEPSALVQIQEGEETVIGRLNSFAGMSSNGKEVVWSYNRPSMLYDALNWSDLIVRDLEKGGKRKLTQKSRLLYPSYSPEGERIAAVYWSNRREGYIRIIRSADASLLDEFKIPAAGFPSSPVWSDNLETIYFLLQNESGRAIFSLDTDNGNITLIKEYSTETVKKLCYWNNYLIYASNAGGFENIMALDLASSDEFQLTSRPFAVENPYVDRDNGILYYSDTRGVNGSVPVSLKLLPDSWLPYERDPEEAEESYPYLARGSWSIHDMEETEFEVLDYSIAGSGFNIHSWGISPNLETMTGLRLNLQSENIMGTFDWAGGLEYDINEQTWGGFLDLNWKQFYPVISFRNSADYRVLSGTELFDVYSRLRLSFPMNLKRDLWDVYLNPAVSGGIRAYLPLNGLAPVHYFPVSSTLAAYAVLPGSPRSIQPDWGIYERFGTSLNPAEASQSFQIYSDTVLYAPGVFRNAGVSLGLALDRQSGQYSLRFPFARGYDSIISNRTLKASADYDFPIAYPDGGLGSFLYIRRIRGNLFYDHLMQGEGEESLRLYRSAGTELIFDLTAANQEQGEFNMGFRFLWLLDEQRPAFQLVFMNAAFL